MKPEIKARWVTALRSGEYNQSTDGYLNDGQGNFCCLGVLCEILHEEMGLDVEVNQFSGTVRYGDKLSFLPPSVMEYAELNTEGGDFLDKEGRPDALYIINDAGVSFDKIANIIEANF